MPSISHTSNLRHLRPPLLALLLLYALAHNVAGLTDAYLACWHWIGTQITSGLLPAHPAGPPR